MRSTTTKLQFLDRREELGRLRALFRSSGSTLGVLFGRRRCGKSRLLEEALPHTRTVYYVADDREAALQRASLAARVGERLPGFERVIYPDWDALFDRFWGAARSGSVLAIDEFPALVSAAGEIPSLLQKRLDRTAGRGIHVVLSGSSQRMMQGLVLERSAPLFGRAREILKIAPLAIGWVPTALGLRDPVSAVEAYSVWGGIPRYWELARDHDSLEQAVRSLVLSPLGVLHDEPSGLLLDDLRDTTQAASILSLIGQGVHRPSEIASRLGKPATSLSRPMRRLVELDLVRRDTPFGVSPRDTKRAIYEVSDPFLRFWFRFVEPNRSRLELGRVSDVVQAVMRELSLHVSGVWEELARLSVPRLRLHGRTWKPASRWWGPGLDRVPMEIDVVAESEDGDALLLGEALWSDRPDGAVRELTAKAERFPIRGRREVVLALWLKRERAVSRDVRVITPIELLRVMR